MTALVAHGTIVLGYALLQAAWQSLLLVAGLAIVFSLCVRASARARYRLAWWAYIAVGVCFLGNVMFGAYLASKGQPSLAILERYEPKAPDQGTSAQIGLPTKSSALAELDALARTTYFERAAAGNRVDVAVYVNRLLKHSIGALGFVWLLSLALAFVIFGRDLVRARSLVRTRRFSVSRDTGLDFCALVDRRRPRLAIEISSSPSVVVPCAVGLRSPIILLPANMEANASREHISAFIAHELEHIVRGDVRRAFVQAALDPFHILNPAARWLSQLVRNLREEACDEAVVAQSIDPVVYARALVTLTAPGRPGTLAASGSRRGQLVERVRCIAGVPRRRWSRCHIALAVASAIAVGTVLTHVGAEGLVDRWLPLPTESSHRWIWISVEGELGLRVRGTDVDIDVNGWARVDERTVAGVTSWLVEGGGFGEEVRITYSVHGLERRLDQNAEMRLLNILLDMHATQRFRDLAEPISGWSRSRSEVADGDSLSILHKSATGTPQLDGMIDSTLSRIDAAVIAGRESNGISEPRTLFAVREALMLAHQLRSHGLVSGSEFDSLLRAISDRLEGTGDLD